MRSTAALHPDTLSPARSGQRYTALLTVAMPAEGAAAAADDDPLYQSSGVRKAVALARLTDALQSW